MKKQKKQDDKIIRLMCKADFDPSKLELIIRRRNKQQQSLKFGLPIFDAFPLPGKILKNKILEFEIFHFDEQYTIKSKKYDFNLTQDELNEYFYDETVTSRIIKLKKLNKKQSQINKNQFLKI